MNAEKNIKLKVCGMRDSENIRDLAEAGPDYLGFIFYEGSKRYMGDKDPALLIRPAGDNLKKVGVFVNQSLPYVESSAKKFSLDFLQLHGEESPEYCRELQEKGHQIIKVFSVDDDFDFGKVDPYKPYCSFFLFDTKSDQYGGTGKSFNWDILKKYDQEVPFFLSGGIDISHAGVIKKMKGLNLHAVDINSRFETAPGVKDVEKVKEFMQGISRKE